MCSDSNIALPVHGSSYHQLCLGLCPPYSVLDPLQPTELTGDGSGLAETLHPFIGPCQPLETRALAWWYLALACSPQAPLSYQTFTICSQGSAVCLVGIPACVLKGKD